MWSIIYLIGTWWEERFWCWWPELDVMSGFVHFLFLSSGLYSKKRNCEKYVVVVKWEDVSVSFCGLFFFSGLVEIVNFRWILTGGQLAQLSSTGMKPMDMASRFPVTILCQFKQSNEVSFTYYDTSRFFHLSDVEHVNAASGSIKLLEGSRSTCCFQFTMYTTHCMRVVPSGCIAE